MPTFNLTKDWLQVTGTKAKVQNITNSRVVVTESVGIPAGSVHGFVLRPFELLECQPIAGKFLYARKLDNDLAQLELLER